MNLLFENSPGFRKGDFIVFGLWLALQGIALLGSEMRVILVIGDVAMQNAENYGTVSSSPERYLVKTRKSSFSSFTVNSWMLSRTTLYQNIEQGSLR